MADLLANLVYQSNIFSVETVDCGPKIFCDNIDIFSTYYVPYRCGIPALISLLLANKFSMPPLLNI